MPQVILKPGLLQLGKRFSPRLNRILKGVNFHVTQDRGLDSAVREIEALRFRVGFVLPIPMFELAAGNFTAVGRRAWTVCQ